MNYSADWVFNFQNRLFTDEHKQRLIFIRRARELGFSLDQVRALLGLTGGRCMTCAKVKGITEQHIAEIRQRVKDLKRLERVLSEMVAHCSGGEMPAVRSSMPWVLREFLELRQFQR